MGFEAEADPFDCQALDVLEQEHGVEVAFNSQVFGVMDGQYDFDSMLSSQELGADSLSQSLLNEGTGGVCTPYDLTQSEPSSFSHHKDPSIVGPITNQAGQHQNEGQQNHAVNSTSVSHSTVVNTPRPLRPFTTRPPSLLRNEYRPESPIDAQSRTMANQAYQNYLTSSPSKYMLSAPSGSSTHQNAQSSLGNFGQSSLEQSRNFITSHIGHDPSSFDVGQYQRLAPYRAPQAYNYIPPSQQAYGPSTPQGYQIGMRRRRELSDMQPSTPPNPSVPLRNNNSNNPRMRMSRQVTEVQPSTPPNLAVQEHYDTNHSREHKSSPDSTVVKREETALQSPLFKPQARKTTRRKTVVSHGVSEDDGLQLTKSDASYIEGLVAAMTDADEAEDNPGMQSTWRKIRENKAARLRETCEDMFNVLKRAQREQLVDRKAVNVYPSFDYRFEETCSTLRTQKTVCKHLMEAPYSHTVANDPTYAAQVSCLPLFAELLLTYVKRVRNNRRVNGQKRQAITMGRQAMGLKGQGKGKGMKKVIPIPFEDLVAGENSGDDFDDDEDEIESPIRVSKGSSRNKKAKKARKADPDDDYEDSAENTPATKKAKRSTRSMRKVADPVNSTQSLPTQSSDKFSELLSSDFLDNPASSGRSSGHSARYLPGPDSSPSQRLEPINPIRGLLQQPNFYDGEYVYAPTAPSLPRVPHGYYNTGHHHQSSPFEPFGYPPLDFSSGTEADRGGKAGDGNDAGAPSSGARA
ncbi:hypothetical protein ACLMJK_003632 [Lecanora helva]